MADQAQRMIEADEGWAVSWTEPACLSQAGSAGFREIVAEGTFADVAYAFVRFRADKWADLCIAFPDRMSAPHYFHAPDFSREVIARLLGKGLTALSH